MKARASFESLNAKTEPPAGAQTHTQDARGLLLAEGGGNFGWVDILDGRMPHNAEFSGVALYSAVGQRGRPAHAPSARPVPLYHCAPATALRARSSSKS